MIDLKNKKTINLSDLVRFKGLNANPIIINKKDGTILGLVPEGKFLAGKDKFPVNLPAFYLALHPVTNDQYKKFVNETGHRPPNMANYGDPIWKGKKFPPEKSDHPVVCVSWDDAIAYCEWAGLRLPTELEWQLAAQGMDGRLWPWGAEFDSTRCNVGIDRPTAVDSYPTGVSPFGVMDLVGNIWQLTNDVYDNGSCRFVIIRGGSYYDPTSSWWYVKGGPQSLNMHQMLLLISPGFDRNATVGFRCVKDVQ